MDRNPVINKTKESSILLAVDDNPDNLYVLQSLISEYLPNCRVVTTLSAKAGLALAAEGNFDGILIDVQMPELGGIEMCRRLKSDGRMADLPVILVTAHHAESTLKVEGLQAGADDFISKPIDNIELVAKIKVLLRIRHAQNELRYLNAHLDQLVAEKTQVIRMERDKLESVFAAMEDGVYVVNQEYEIEYVNPVVVTDFGPHEGSKCYTYFHSRNEPCPWCRNAEVFAGKTVRWESTPVTNGKTYDVIDTPLKNTDGSISKLEILRDITERKQADQDREELQTQLNQAQKMESVGRLAGGVAHDFNNMLGVILGHTEMALDEVDPGLPLFSSLQEIHKAAKRSTDLTRQLLAFARKQTIAPRVLDLNETIEGMLKMLRRLIGEEIELAWRPDSGSWQIKVDPSQIDQILANLCVNARDAIEGVGQVAIETGNAILDEDYCAENPGAVPGEYVLLTVSDDGRGMDRETLDNLFEPFFTTKEMGTGLGLSTVYGIVKQNNGFITVRSKPGTGAIFKIYLPRHAGRTEQSKKEGPAEPAVRGHETILLVEDEPAILKMAMMMLELLGYTVLGASTPGEAIRVAGEHAGHIHLLITDVVMPEMNGRELAKNLLSLYPEMKHMFMSGYTAEVIAHRGVIDEGVNFIHKPFATQDLAAKVREVLEQE